MGKENTKQVKKNQIRSAVIRFCGDSGDGMQVAGTQFSNTTGMLGNDLMTFPDFPAEIRAPQGSPAGVSGFQVHFSEDNIFTPGDQVDVLVAMNPAALKTNIEALRTSGILILNSDSFDERNIKKAGYTQNPLDEEAKKKLKEKYNLFTAPITQLTINGLMEGLHKLKELTRNDAQRCKNFFALGMLYWLFERNLEYSLSWIEKKFQKKKLFLQANQIALKAGYYFAETSELFSVQYEVSQAKLSPGLYRNINGGTALVMGLLTAAQKTRLPLFYAGYPITPASEILHEISQHQNFNVKTFQAEDEIAAASAAIGASYGGHIGITASSGPGIMLKGEAISLAIMTELPLVIINAQRGGPSTGLPTKTEQGDLFLALFGRSSESPLAIVAPSTPKDAFFMIIEAVRLAVQFMTPVFFLTDLYLNLGSEPWLIPDISKIPDIASNLIRSSDEVMEDKFLVYKRNEQTLARRWAIPGTPNIEHRIGGLEKDALTGNVSYDPENHESMVKTRAQKIANIARSIPKQEIFGNSQAKLLVLGWGSTYGVIHTAVLSVTEKGHAVAHAHLRYLNPLPPNIEELLSRYQCILIPEMNTGQLFFYLQGKLRLENSRVRFEKINKIKGQPFLVSEIEEKIISLSQSLA